MNITEEKAVNTLYFSVVWLLLVLGDKYQFIHTDFHKVWQHVKLIHRVNPSNRSNVQVFINRQLDDKVIDFNVANVELVKNSGISSMRQHLKTLQKLPRPSEWFFRRRGECTTRV